MRRREFIGLLGGAAAWPLAARAQQGERMRRIAALMNQRADDAEGRARHVAFVDQMRQLGWAEGRNLHIDTRWGASDAELARRYTTELVALAPDLILATGSVSMPPLLQATRNIPIVFATVPDPVGAGYIDNLARPGGNVTGFTPFEFGIGAKWLEVLKEIAPQVKRVAVVRDPAISAGLGQFGAIQSVAPSLGVELTPVNIRDAAELQRAIEAFASGANGGLILTGSALAVARRELIIALAARHKLPGVYYERFFAGAGGLIAYGANLVEQYRQAAGYVDRILRGEKPADLPVQTPTKYELVINLKTARALGLEIPPTLLARADEVIE